MGEWFGICNVLNTPRKSTRRNWSQRNWSQSFISHRRDWRGGIGGNSLVPGPCFPRRQCRVRQTSGCPTRGSDFLTVECVVRRTGVDARVGRPRKRLERFTTGGDRQSTLSDRSVSSNAQHRSARNCRDDSSSFHATGRVSFGGLLTENGSGRVIDRAKVDQPP